MNTLDFQDTFYSLWLIPENEEPFKSIISTENSNPFHPHLTIVTKLDIKDIPENFCDNLNPISAVPRRVHFGESKTMALFVEFCLDMNLWTLRNQLLKKLNINDDERPFNPHLSLFYGNLKFERYLLEKEKVEQQLPPKVKFNRIWLQKIHGTPDNWTTEKEFTL
ncbi:MAG: hypothetical protein KC493_11000 [Bacteriovoracaceae bacterium]|nr:hypothetical protein [Bacteriovoracaceae bacterium]